MRSLVITAVVLSALGGVACAQERTLNTYGYFDLEYEIDRDSESGGGGTFDQHHFNIISSYVLDAQFRVLGEIEWEHGFAQSGSEGVGELKLERAWVEYRHTDAVKLRAGKYLLPYGIYNLIHDATPTFLSSSLPHAIYGKYVNPLGQKQRLYSKFGTGIQVLGTVFPRGWTVEYAAYLSNGQGAEPFENDDNADKAWGGRLIVEAPRTGLRVGSSFYTELNGEAAHTRQRSLAFDATWRKDRFELQGEAAFGWLQEVDENVVPTDGYRHTMGAYAQVAYTVAERFTPFARLSAFDSGATDLEGDETHWVGGLNVSVTPRVYLKGEAHGVAFGGEAILPDMFIASIAVAF